MIPASELGMRGAVARYADRPPLDPDDLVVPGPRLRVPVKVGRNDVVVNSLDTGGDGPVVALVHGLSSTMGFWHFQVPWLVSRGFRVLALDLPGFGASDRPDAAGPPPWYAALLAAWSDALGLQPALWMGHSMGGHVLLSLALAAPARVPRLALSAPAGLETFSPEAAQWMRDFWHPHRASEATEVEVRLNFTQLVFNRLDGAPGAHVEQLLEERVRVQRHPSFAAWSRAVSRCIAGMLNHPVAHRLGEIQAPTLVIFGDQDRMIPNPVFNKHLRTADLARAACAAMPAAQMALLPGAGHMPHHDDPAGFHAALEPFLKPLLGASPAGA